MSYTYYAGSSISINSHSCHIAAWHCKPHTQKKPYMKAALAQCCFSDQIHVKRFDEQAEASVKISFHMI